LLTIAGLAGCGPTAEARYLLALTRCVDKSSTGAEADACKLDVDRQFRVHGDAGDGAR
jgi:hypothetical protein